MRQVSKAESGILGGDDNKPLKKRKGENDCFKHQLL